MTVMIANLPPETLVEIVPPLDYADIYALMLCSKSLYFKLFPSLYQEIVLITHGPYDRPLLTRSPRRLTERQRKKFFASVVDGTIPDDALGSIKWVIMTDVVSETYLSEAIAPERIEIFRHKMLPKMTKLQRLDLILGQATVFMPRTSTRHCMKYYIDLVAELQGVQIALDLAGKGFKLAAAFAPKNPTNIIHFTSSLPSYVSWDVVSINNSRRLLADMLTPLTHLRTLDLEGGLEEPVEFFDFALFEGSLPHLESLTLRRIFQPKHLLPTTNLERFKRLELQLCDVFDREFDILARMENLNILIIDQTSFLPVRAGPPTNRQPDLAPLSEIKLTKLRTFHIICDPMEHKRAFEVDEPAVKSIAVAPPNFISQVIRSNPQLRCIIVPSLSDADLSVLAEPSRAQHLEVLELLVPAMVGIPKPYTSIGLLELFSVPCKRLRRIRFSTLNAKISLEMLMKLFTGSRDLRDLSWDCLDFDRSGNPQDAAIREYDMILEEEYDQPQVESDEGVYPVGERLRAGLERYYHEQEKWATKVLFECFVPEDGQFIVERLAKLRFTQVVDQVYSLATSEYLNAYKIIDGVDSIGVVEARRDGLLGFRDLLGVQ